MTTGGPGYLSAMSAAMTGNGRLDQSFATTPGQTYYVAARLRIDAETVAPTWGGVRVQAVNSSWSQLGSTPYYRLATAGAGVWTRATFSFVANSAASRVVFQNFSNGSFNARVDDIVVSTSPIPDASAATSTPAGATATSTATRTATPAPIATATAPATATATAASVATATRTPTATSTVTRTPTRTATPAATATRTPTPQAVSNLLVNGTFETGTLSSWQAQGTISANGPGYLSTFAAAMAGNGRIDQVISTVAGQTYYISARLRIDAESVPATWGGVRVQVVGSNWAQLATSPYYRLGTAGAGVWTRATFSFVASSTTSRVIFQNFSNGSFNARVDDMIVSSSPIP